MLYSTERECIEMTTTITGIKKAVSEFNNWTQGGARIYFDKTDKKVWCNIYPDGNSWDDYHDANIVELTHKGFSMASQWNKITMVELKELCEQTEAE